MNFEFIGEVLSLRPGQEIRTVHTVPSNEALLVHQLPGVTVVRGTVLTELMAHAGAKCLEGASPERGEAVLTRVNSADFREWVHPDQRLTIHVRVAASKPQFATAEGQVLVVGRKVASASLLFCFVRGDTAVAQSGSKRANVKPLRSGEKPGKS